MPDQSKLEAMRADDRRIRDAVAAVDITGLNSYEIALARADAAEHARRLFTPPIQVIERDIELLISRDEAEWADTTETPYILTLSVAEGMSILKTMYRDVKQELPSIKHDYRRHHDEIESEFNARRAALNREATRTKRFVNKVLTGQIPLPSIEPQRNRHTMTLKQIRAEQLQRYTQP